MKKKVKKSSAFRAIATNQTCGVDSCLLAGPEVVGGGRWKVIQIENTPNINHGCRRSVDEFI